VTCTDCSSEAAPPSADQKDSRMEKKTSDIRRPLGGVANVWNLRLGKCSSASGRIEPRRSRVPRSRYHGVMEARIRSETAEDAAAIEAVTIDAFAAAAHSDHGEHLILDTLRKADQLTVSLVAELDLELVGHIAASPVSISDGSRDWTLLARPLSPRSGTRLAAPYLTVRLISVF
jgi:hypothetical protein